jgi:hypothetical protein
MFMLLSIREVPFGKVNLPFPVSGNQVLDPLISFLEV